MDAELIQTLSNQHAEADLKPDGNGLYYVNLGGVDTALVWHLSGQWRSIHSTAGTPWVYSIMDALVQTGMYSGRLKPIAIEKVPDASWDKP